MDKQDRLRSYVERRSGGGGSEGIDQGLDPLALLIDATPLAKDDRERETAARAHAKLLRNEQLDPYEMNVYEAIVVPTDRPPLIVRSGSFSEPPQPWTKLGLAPTRPRLEEALRAVGRVEIVGPTLLPYAGTAFVVGPGLLMTNRHVANLFCHGVGTTIRFIDGFGAALNFAREQGNPGRDIPVARVLMIHPYWDMALLSVEGIEAVSPLTLAPVPPADRVGAEVALIGYPARDLRTDAGVQDRVFDGTYGVKRLQPGFVLGERQFRSAGHLVSTLAHDASTLGGNSGSCVLDIETGRVIGLHFAGEYLKANYAVPACELSRDRRVRNAGVLFASGSPENPSPWETDWTLVTGDRAAARAASRVQDDSPEVCLSIALEISLRTDSSQEPS